MLLLEWRGLSPSFTQVGVLNRVLLTKVIWVLHPRTWSSRSHVHRHVWWLQRLSVSVKTALRINNRLLLVGLWARLNWLKPLILEFLLQSILKQQLPSLLLLLIVAAVSIIVVAIWQTIVVQALTYDLVVGKISQLHRFLWILAIYLELTCLSGLRVVSVIEWKSLVRTINLIIIEVLLLGLGLSLMLTYWNWLLLHALRLGGVLIVFVVSWRKCHHSSVHYVFVLVRPIHLLDPPNLTIILVLALRTPCGVRHCLKAHNLILTLTTCFSSAVVSMIQHVL